MLQGFLVLLVTIAPAPVDLHQFVGQEVTLTGTWNKCGKVGPYVTATGGQAYIVGSDTESWPEMDGKTVHVTGVLRFRKYEVHLRPRPRDHFYFEAESTRIEFPKD